MDSGGVISDYEDSGTFYRAHIFTTSGSLVVTQVITVDILAVGGGGGSGKASGNGNFGGAGAGGMLTQTGVSIASKRQQHVHWLLVENGCSILVTPLVLATMVEMV